MPLLLSIRAILRPAIQASGQATGWLLYSGETPTLYAAPTDQGTGDGSSEANAMDLVTALTLVNDDDVLGILPGTYTGTPSGSNNSPIFTTTNSGSAGHPIKLVAKYAAAYYQTNRSEFRSSSPYTDAGNGAGWTANCPVIGFVSKSYVHVVGVYANQLYAPPRPSNGTFLIDGCTAIEWHNCAVDQIVVPTGDNFNSFFDRGNQSTVIKNFKVNGGGNSGNHNACAICSYGSQDFLYSHIEAEDTNTVIYVKGSNGGIGNDGDIEYCKSIGATASFIEVAEVQPASDGVDIRNCLSIRDRDGIVFENSVSARCTDIRVRNVTIVDATRFGVYLESAAALTNCEILDSVIAFMSATSADAINCEPSISPVNSNYNVFYEAGGSVTFAQNSTPYTGLTNWDNTGKDVNSTEADPGFTDAGADDYRRAGTDTGSSTGGKRGAYVTGLEQLGLEA